MPSMIFTSIPRDPKALPKVIKFDSSPGYAISCALGRNHDPNSYTPKLISEKKGEKDFEIWMRRKETELSPGPHPLEKLGTLHWTQPTW